MEPLPLVVVAQPGPARDGLLSRFSSVDPQVADSWNGFLGMGLDGWGIVVLGPEVPATEVMTALGHQTVHGTPWVILQAAEKEGEWVLRPLSLGHGVEPARVAQIAAAPEAEGPILDLHWSLRVIAKARHDLNNPLTSGLAEVQLLLMDEHPPEVKEALETIQEQFRRLRDMVADLSRLRVPKPQSNPFS